jgi:hypothetical protein
MTVLAAGTAGFIAMHIEQRLPQSGGGEMCIDEPGDDRYSGSASARLKRVARAS